MNTPTAIKSRLFSLQNRGVKYDLDRMYEAASLCGNPHHAYKSVHVAGTNGKGSTCAYIESILRHAGYKTGLYTSPHLINFEERFKINGADIAEADWFGVYCDLEKIIADLKLTFFEAATLMAFEIFKRAGVEYAILETGMGGRLDATNIVTPKVSVITKIAMDHQEYLGGDLAAIAGEKLGIVKPCVPLVMLEPEDQKIRQLASDHCTSVGAELSFVNTNCVQNVSYQNGGISFELPSGKYDLAMSGYYQIQNALLAFAAVGKTGIFADHQKVYEGLKAAALPGRFHAVSFNNRTVILDVAHNPDAARVLVDTLDARFPGKRVSFVVGMMKDKDIMATLGVLASRAYAFYFGKPRTERAAEPMDMCRTASKKFSGIMSLHPTIDNALRCAAAVTMPSDVVCVTGSFFTVGEAWRATSEFSHDTYRRPLPPS